MFYAGVWDICTRFLAYVAHIDERVCIPICVVIVFTLSLGMSYIYRYIWNAVEKKLGIYNLVDNILKNKSWR